MFDDLDPDEMYPPVPDPDHLTRFFWEGVADQRLMILRCDNCGFYIHLPRVACRNCLSTTLTAAQVSGQATLATWTFPNQPSDPYYLARIPYALAVVELVEQSGLKMVTNLVDFDKGSLRIDMPVQVTFSEVAPHLTLPLFTPVPAGA